MAAVPESAAIVNALRSGLVPNAGPRALRDGPRSARRGREPGARLRRRRQGAVEVDSRRVRDRKDVRCTVPLRARLASGGSPPPKFRSRSTTRRCIISKTVYRRLIERLETAADGPNAFQAIVEGWLYQIGDEVTRLRGISEDDPGFADATEQRLEDKLADLSKRNPAFAQVLRAYHRATHEGDFATAQGLLAWLAGQPHTDRSVLKAAGTKGKVDGQASLTFLAGLLQLLRQSGYAGLVVVLDEVETVQRMNAQTREKSLNALRQLMDMLAKEELPGPVPGRHRHAGLLRGLQGPEGLAPLYQRVQVNFGEDRPLRQPAGAAGAASSVHRRATARRSGRASATSIRRRTRSASPQRVDDRFLSALVAKVTAGFGGKVALAPRLFLRELIDVMDRVDIHEDYDPATHYQLELDDGKLTPRNSPRSMAAPVELAKTRAPTRPERQPRSPKRLDG